MAHPPTYRQLAAKAAVARLPTWLWLDRERGADSIVVIQIHGLL